MAIQKVRLIVSPVSRPAQARRVMPAVARLFKERGLVVEEFVTRGPGDPARLAREARDVCDAVVMAGGDGSINEVMNALRNSSTVVGIIPLGTVNVFAREMGIPLDPLKSAEAFLKGRVESFDMGRLGDRSFLLMAGFGFDSLVLRKNPAFLKRCFGRYSYVLTGLTLLPFYREQYLDVEWDGGNEKARANFAVFSNARYYGGEYLLAPDADMRDGLLDATFFLCPGRIGLFRIFSALIRGDVSNKPWVRRARACRFSLHPQSKALFQIDGDPVPDRPGEVTVEKGAINVMVPAPV